MPWTVSPTGRPASSARSPTSSPNWVSPRLVRPRFARVGQHQVDVVVHRERVHQRIALGTGIVERRLELRPGLGIYQSPAVDPQQSMGGQHGGRLALIHPKDWTRAAPYRGRAPPAGSGYTTRVPTPLRRGHPAWPKRSSPP